MSTAQQEVKALKQDIASIKNMLADQLEGTISNGESRTIFDKNELQRVAHQAGKATRAFIADKQEKISNAKGKCEETIKERPFTSTAVAFAGGVILTALLKRK